MSGSLYGGHKMTQTTFVKLNKKRSTTNKGLGHSSMSKFNFDRRNSTTTQATTSSSQEKASIGSAPEGRSLTQTPLRAQLQSVHHLSCNGFKGQFDYTEQRCNYERLAQQQEEKQQQQQFQRFDRQMWPSELVSPCDILPSRLPSCSKGSSNISSISDNNLFNSSTAVDSEFLALQQFRIQNSNECYGNGRLLDLQLQQQQQQQSTGKFISSSLGNGSPSVIDLTSKPMPYALRQSLLRSKMAKDICNRKTKKEFLTSGLNKSCALSYQPMY